MVNTEEAILTIRSVTSEEFLQIILANIDPEDIENVVLEVREDETSAVIRTIDRQSHIFKTGSLVLDDLVLDILNVI